MAHRCRPARALRGVAGGALAVFAARQLRPCDGAGLVIGDNRNRGYDGRFWGFVKLDQIEGRAMFHILVVGG